MKKSKLIIVLYIYFFICVIHSTYKFYEIGKNYFYPKKEQLSSQEKKVTNVTKSIPNKKENKQLVRKEITEFNYNFLKNNELYPISKNIELNDNEFNIYKKQYNYFLNKYFTQNQLNGVQGIIIADAQQFSDKSQGITETINGNSYITMAAKSGDTTCIIHEACHAMHAKYIDVFNIFYKEKWLRSKNYVSDYAKTDIYEDFAETGTAYLIGDTSSNNPKFKIFAEFYNRIK